VSILIRGIFLRLGKWRALAQVLGSKG